MKKETTAPLISRVYQKPAYQGKHIIIIGGRIYATKTGSAKTELLERLLKKYPKDTPVITYIPAEDSLILLVL